MSDIGGLLIFTNAMIRFDNGTYYDYTTGRVRIYMTKPKGLSTIMKWKFKFGSVTLCADEFKNRRGVTMLSFSGVLVVLHSDFKSEIIKLRRRIHDEINCLSNRDVSVIR